MLHQGVVAGAICLDPLGMYGGAFPKIQRAALQGNKICGTTHFSAQSVNFIDEVPFCGAADGGVAGHVGDCVKGKGEKNRVNAHARASERGFDSGMSRADDHDLCF